jgi:hypothetical protein
MSIYKAIHDNLVNSRKHLKEEWKPTHSGLERHRILPAHQGGKYTEDNCTYLTHREHYLAHFLLWKLYGDIRDKFVAVRMRGSFVGGVPHTKESKAKLAKAHLGRKKISLGAESKSVWPEEVQSYLDKGWSLGHPVNSTARMGRAKGYKHSEETKAKMKGSKKNFVPWNKGKKIDNKRTGLKHSEESRKKMSESAKGRIPWNKGKKIGDKCKPKKG